MSLEKQFSIEKPQNKPEHFGYKNRILGVISDIEKKIRVVNPDDQLFNELHAKRRMDSRAERQEFEAVRKDICETFGVNQDEDHVYLYSPHKGPESIVEQRALRCFYVLIDAENRDAFYGEGRTLHHFLFEKLVKLMEKKYPNINSEFVIDHLEGNPPKYIAFKGFLSTKEFKEISDSSRKVLETPLYDQNGQKIETADTWFITGHNLETMFPPSPENKASEPKD